MATDMFLEFAGDLVGLSGMTKVVGESTDPQHQNMVRVNEFAFSIENKQTIGSATGGAGAGKAVFDSLTITKSVDLSSPALLAASGSGAHFPQVNLYVRKSGGGPGAPGDYLVYRFKLVFVSKLSWSNSSGDDQPREYVEFTYGALQVQYAAMSASGQLGAPTQQTWNVMTNRPDFTVPGVPG